MYHRLFVILSCCILVHFSTLPGATAQSLADEDRFINELLEEFGLELYPSNPVELAASNPSFPACGIQPGGQCGGSCSDPRHICKLKYTLVEDEFEFDGGGSERERWETKCLCEAPSPSDCADRDLGSGIACGGTCAPTRQGKPRVCHELTLGSESACLCRGGIQNCKLVIENGQATCQGVCSDGGCVVNENGDGCVCGNSCKIAIQGGQVVCQGSCTSGGLCILSENGDACGCVLPRRPGPAPGPIEQCRSITDEGEAKLGFAQNSCTASSNACKKAYDRCVANLSSQCNGELREVSRNNGCRKQRVVGVGGIGVNKCTIQCSATCCETPDSGGGGVESE